MYVYVYNYVHSISCMCVWLADCWLWYNLFMCMISCMIRPPCEITDQLAVGTQNCFSTLFYTPYINIKTSAQNAPKCIIARQKKIKKKFWGGGTAPSPYPSPLGRWYPLPRSHPLGASILAPSVLSLSVPVPFNLQLEYWLDRHDESYLLPRNNIIPLFLRWTNVIERRLF